MDLVVGLVGTIILIAALGFILRRAWRRGFSSPPPPSQWFGIGQRANQQALEHYDQGRPHAHNLRVRRHNRGVEINPDEATKAW